jgi:hypothetical protein
MPDCGFDRPFNPRLSIFAGMSPAALLTALQNAQQAYLDLTTGAKVEVAAYTQGDGSKSVTYTRANIGALTTTILELQAQLGMRRHGRRPMRMVFR